jgi:hypothetical protein
MSLKHFIVWFACVPASLDAVKATAQGFRENLPFGDHVMRGRANGQSGTLRIRHKLESF